MPLRGRKGTMFEGGHRAAAFIWSANDALLPAVLRGSVHDGMIHITDWYPTMLSVATGGAWQPDEGQVRFIAGPPS